MAYSRRAFKASEMVDPRAYLEGNRRIVVDASALLESRDGLAGGIPQLVLNCADAIHANRNPLVVPRAVFNELSSQTKPWRASKKPELAQRAQWALDMVNDLVADGLATTSFGGIEDRIADPEFVDIAQVAAEQGWEICLLTGDNTLKLEVRLLGKLTSTAQIAGSVTSDGMVELESAEFLYSKGRDKKNSVADHPGKADEYDRLNSVLPQWRKAFGLVPPQKVPPPTNRRPAVQRISLRPFSSVERLKTGDREVEFADFPREGDHVDFHGVEGKGQVVLAARISRGKEGSVYEVEDDQYKVAKVFKRGKLSTHRQEKVELLVSHGLRSPGICFPEAVLTVGGTPVGYLMRRAQDARVLNETIFIPEQFAEAYPGWTRTDLVDVCISFLKRVQVFHDLNILIGDINPNNVMLGNQKDIWVIDTDSAQFEGYPCPVGWDEFTPPELIGARPGIRTVEHELFGVAVMLFMIMMTGTFPYERRGSDDTVENIKSGLFPYGFDGHSERDLQPPLKWLYVWSHLSMDLKSLFGNTFHRDGNRFGYGNRPSIKEWLDAFERFKKTLARPLDPMSLQIFPIRHKAERDARLFDCGHCGSPSAIAEFKPHPEATEFRRPSRCNNCLPKCESCRRPTEPELLRNGSCRTCSRPTPVRASQPRMTGTGRAPVRPAAPAKATASRSVAGHAPARKAPAKKVATQKPSPNKVSSTVAKKKSPTKKSSKQPKSVAARISRWFKNL